MQVTTWIAAACMVLGLLAAIRSAHLLSTRRPGRFTLDPWASFVIGFSLMLLGQYLLRR